MIYVTPKHNRRKLGVIRGESLTLIALAIGTYLVLFEFQQTLDDLLVLSSLGRRSTSRHHS